MGSREHRTDVPGALRRCAHWALVVALAVGSATCLVIALWAPASTLGEPIPGGIDPRAEREMPSPAEFESAPIGATHRLARAQHRPCGVGTLERDAGRGGPPSARHRFVGSSRVAAAKRARLIGRPVA